tara:strand:+ start:11363 stop:11566 length:204 start_codon:yes stop_codon:yes gene_type:complete
MNKYKVTATSMQTLFVEIEAETEQEAWNKGCDMCGGCYEADGDPDWEYSEVYLIEGKEPEDDDKEED